MDFRLPPIGIGRVSSSDSNKENTPPSNSCKSTSSKTQSYSNDELPKISAQNAKTPDKSQSHALVGITRFPQTEGQRFKDVRILRNVAVLGRNSNRYLKQYGVAYDKLVNTIKDSNYSDRDVQKLLKRLDDCDAALLRNDMECEQSDREELIVNVKNQLIEMKNDILNEEKTNWLYLKLNKIEDQCIELLEKEKNSPSKSLFSNVREYLPSIESPPWGNRKTEVINDNGAFHKFW